MSERDARNTFLVKLMVLVFAGGGGLALVIGGAQELKNGVGSALLALPLMALGVGLVVTAWRVMGSKFDG